MADQPFTPKPISPVPPANPPAPIAPPMPARPITPPAGIPVKDTNISNLSPSPSPTPLPPRPVSLPPAPTPFKSTVRTMEQDLSGAKPAPVPTPTASPRPVPPPTPIPRPSVSIPPPPAPKAPAPSVTVPPPMHDGPSKKWLIIGALLIVVVGLLVWFLAIRKSSAPEPTPTPTSTPTATPTATPTPTPLSFQTVFHPETATISTTLDAFVSSQKLAVGELRAYNLSKSLSQFATEQKLSIPADITAGVDGNDFTLFLFGKPDTTNSRGLAVKVTDNIKVQSALTAWEATMPSNLKTIFKINLARSASKTFLGNTYQGIPLRYRNFPDALSSIDYALVTMPDSNTYLIIVNSRDHMFGLIDRALGIALGK